MGSCGRLALRPAGGHHDVRPPGPLRSAGQPDRPRHHEHRVHGGRGDQFRGHGRRRRQRVEAHRGQLAAYEGLCRELGAQPAAVAVAWLLRNPVVCTTIVGASMIDELRSDLDALSVRLDDEVMERVDQIWPGPGEAPQSYAW
ncbi:hypothetical protein DLJ58_04370 [Micromonospora arida]|uniref:NADP-dependent oxidoreductase domain-containing protein n=1 Tax=Micromonospora arida TaxID=2203715 RepID=A0A3N9XJ67_9ACTN|nr:hypothetical protein DLJ58_04370 [Micromonospora arida]